ncbi:tripartite tricarboxylate transporter substrate binding protein, partial [Achromobacter sp. Marseille-Q0513]|uniref:tripartite tricarboxylate transporter substrate-binding protein n=1 Tax=Achromobacter sp. Marseille-Q0513 TaxID=2829161 RepID=UPI001B9A4D6F
DGATLLLTATSPITIFPNLAKTQYDPLASFVPIGSAAVGPVVIAATSALQVRNFAALLAKAREKPDQLTFGVPGLGSVAHLGMAALMEQTDTKMRQIPYRGNSQALTDGLGGVVDLLVTNSDVLLP